MSVNTILWCGNTMWWQQAELIALSTLMLISCLHRQSNLIFLNYREHGEPLSPSMYIEYKVAICCLLTSNCISHFWFNFAQKCSLVVFKNVVQFVMLSGWLFYNRHYQCKWNCKDQNNLCIKAILEINCQYRHTLSQELYGRDHIKK